MAKPKLQSSNPEEDWICNLLELPQTLSHKNSKLGFLASLFNGTVSVYSGEKRTKINNQKITNEVIKASTIAGNETSWLVNGGYKGDLVLSEISIDKKGAVKFDAENLVTSLVDGTSVEALATNPLRNELFASGGSDKSLYLWKIEENFKETYGSTTQKSRKSDGNQERLFQPFASVVAHTDTITSLSWLDYNHIITGS